MNCVIRKKIEYSAAEIKRRREIYLFETNRNLFYRRMQGEVNRAGSNTLKEMRGFWGKVWKKVDICPDKYKEC